MAAIACSLRALAQKASKLSSQFAEYLGYRPVPSRPCDLRLGFRLPDARTGSELLAEAGLNSATILVCGPILDAAVLDLRQGLETRYATFLEQLAHIPDAEGAASRLDYARAVAAGLRNVYVERCQALISDVVEAVNSRLQAPAQRPACTGPQRGGRRGRPCTFSKAQVDVLTRILEYVDQLDAKEKEFVSRHIGLTPQQINRWFCNARARGHRKSPYDHGPSKKKIEAAILQAAVASYASTPHPTQPAEPMHQATFVQPQQMPSPPTAAPQRPRPRKTRGLGSIPPEFWTSDGFEVPFAGTELDNDFEKWNAWIFVPRKCNFPPKQVRFAPLPPTPERPWRVGMPPKRVEPWMMDLPPEAAAMCGLIEDHEAKALRDAGVRIVPRSMYRLPPGALPLPPEVGAAEGDVAMAEEVPAQGTSPVSPPRQAATNSEEAAKEAVTDEQAFVLDEDFLLAMDSHHARAMSPSIDGAFPPLDIPVPSQASDASVSTDDVALPQPEPLQQWMLDLIQEFANALPEDPIAYAALDMNASNLGLLNNNFDFTNLEVSAAPAEGSEDTTMEGMEEMLQPGDGSPESSSSEEEEPAEMDEPFGDIYRAPVNHVTAFLHNQRHPHRKPYRRPSAHKPSPLRNSVAAQSFQSNAEAAAAIHAAYMAPSPKSIMEFQMSLAQCPQDDVGLMGLMHGAGIGMGGMVGIDAPPAYSEMDSMDVEMEVCGGEQQSGQQQQQQHDPSSPSHFAVPIASPEAF